jgi:hypothetical protein
VIVDAIVTIVAAILTSVLSLVPGFTGSDPLAISGIANIGAELGGALAFANKFFPVTVLGVCLGITLAIRTFGTAWALLVWVYDRIPFKAT